MFRNDRREKLRNRVILAAMGVAVMTFGIWLNYRDSAQEPLTEETAQQIEAEETKAEKTKITTEQEAEEKADHQRTDTEPKIEAYLIKEVDGVVKVFLCDESGSERLYLTTTIPFELLSESDQQLFIDGVRLDTEEDLGKFLENFDS